VQSSGAIYRNLQLGTLAYLLFLLEEQRAVIMQQKMYSAEGVSGFTAKRPRTVVWWFIAIAMASVVAYSTCRGAISSRIANPDVPETSRATVATLKSWPSGCAYCRTALHLLPG
jgi:hypothetical protein